jgi:2-methylcitrate dehydratase PrpD
MTGPETSLDGRHGLFRQFTGDEGAAGRFRTLIGGLGREWHLPKAAYKFYPCCHYLHPFIEAAGQLAERGVRANDVEHIVCRVPQGEAAVICEPWETKQAPATGHAARWSLPIAVAARLVEGKVDLATFETTASGAVREFARRASLGSRCRKRAFRSASKPNWCARRKMEIKACASTMCSAITPGRRARRRC